MGTSLRTCRAIGFPLGTQLFEITGFAFRCFFKSKKFWTPAFAGVTALMTFYERIRVGAFVLSPHCAMNFPAAVILFPTLFGPKKKRNFFN